MLQCILYIFFQNTGNSQKPAKWHEVPPQAIFPNPASEFNLTGAFFFPLKMGRRPCFHYPYPSLSRKTPKIPLRSISSWGSHWVLRESLVLKKIATASKIILVVTIFRHHPMASNSFSTRKGTSREPWGPFWEDWKSVTSENPFQVMTSSALCGLNSATGFQQQACTREIPVT